MKQLSLYVFALLLLASCGGSKKAIENKAQKQEVTQQTQTTEPVKEVVEEQVERKEKVEKVKEFSNTNTETVKPLTEAKKPVEAFNHSSYHQLLQTHVSKEGNVDYDAIKNKRIVLTEYISSLGENLPEDTWSKEDKLAYWINAYNALTIDLILRHYPLNSIKDIKDPWKQRFWQLGDKWYNLDEIEHQILRKMDEPRIHFAIVCASFSCPKLQNEAFTAGNLEDQLTNATEEFLSDTSRNEISEDNLKLSKIFKWFAKDFKTNGTLIDFLNQYSDIEISAKAKRSFKDYSWDLND
ncbi:MAG: DUF547 domain-containing protein [Winogradskyella sp.]|uniref:DUF547 domain-containing protein n=1 Tax=Winogradskyella sp. TaxID=1883156 RepID=UPI000F3FC9EF|nr:DUF547 domain-containing protein [Winogradskyella sp.]RNC84152.1 MAG: DUF547 domain-containing protein [Winogradskyella sp.]